MGGLIVVGVIIGALVVWGIVSIVVELLQQAAAQGCWSLGSCLTTMVIVLCTLALVGIIMWSAVKGLT